MVVVVVVANGFDFAGPDDGGGNGLVAAVGCAKGFNLACVLEDGANEFEPNGFVKVCVCVGILTLFRDSDINEGTSFEESTDPALT